MHKKDNKEKKNIVLVSDALNAGNCLYYSLSDQLYGSFDRGDDIRQQLANHMVAHKKYFMQFVVAEGGERRRPKRAAASAYATRSADVASPTDEDKERRFEEMVATTRKNGEWGSSESIQAFCQVFRVDINVYTLDGVQAFRDVNALPEENRDVIHIAFHVSRWCSFRLRAVDVWTNFQSRISNTILPFGE